MKMLITFYFITIVVFAQAQQLKNKFSIRLNDNFNTQYLENDYHFTNDSLIITALSDKGKTPVNYLKRKLTHEEKKKLHTFLFTYNLDSLNSEYFSAFTNLKMIDYLHFPRIISVDFSTKNKSLKKSKLTNCYVFRIADIINVINTMIPAEVRIKYNKGDFDKAY